MNNYEEIKNLIEASRRALSKNINESSKKQIRKQYGLLNEQKEEEVDVDIDADVSFDEKRPKKDSDEIGKPKDKQKTYKIQGNLLVLNGKTEADIQLTTDEKNAFVETVDEFRTEVAELAEFDKLKVYHDNVEWSGKILELDLEFFYTIKEPNGIYINSDMMKLDEKYLEMIPKIQSFYEKFKNKWSKIVSSRLED
jgi:hypothetical protein